MTRALTYRLPLTLLGVFLVLALHAPANAGDPQAPVVLQVADARSEAADRFFLKAVKLYRSGDLTGAAEQFKLGLSINPENPVAHYYYAETLKAMQREAEALAHYEKAAKFGPDTTEGIMAAAVMPGLRRKVEATEKKKTERKAEKKAAAEKVHCSPFATGTTDVIKVCSEKIRAFAEQQVNPSKFMFKDPAYMGADYHTIRANAYFRNGNFSAAVRDFERSMDLEKQVVWENYPGLATPDMTRWEALRGFAWLRATCRDKRYRSGADAVRLALEAVRMHRWPQAQDTLAAAYAEAGRFGDAVREQQAAIANLSDSGKQQFLKQFQARLALYRQGKPYRAP